MDRIVENGAIDKSKVMAGLEPIIAAQMMVRWTSPIVHSATGTMSPFCKIKNFQMMMTCIDDEAESNLQVTSLGG